MARHSEALLRQEWAVDLGHKAGKFLFRLPLTLGQCAEIERRAGDEAAGQLPEDHPAHVAWVVWVLGLSAETPDGRSWRQHYPAPQDVLDRLNMADMVELEPVLAEFAKLMERATAEAREGAAAATGGKSFRRGAARAGGVSRH